MSWIHYALLSGFLLGIRTMIARLSQSLGLSSSDGVAYQSLSVAVISFTVYIVFAFSGYGRLGVSSPGISSALFVGVLNGVAMIAIFLALKDGLMPLVTVLVFAVSLLVVTVSSPIMGNALEFKHYVAAVLAIIAASLTI